MCEEQTTPIEEADVTEDAVDAPESAQKPEKKKKKADKEMEALREELDAEKERYTRMLAEYANYKRRTEQEKESIGQYAKSEILRQLLPSLDNLERAVDAPDGPDYRKGVDMIIDKLHEELQKLGLEEIPALGQPFDPEVHHAVMREDADGVETETVTEVFQKGYRFGDRVIRPAMVKVAN
ncbi:MAG: nucleotide exchange factor GrpE [Clostridia bacterium]|nr:nucleotide exchange factor GrpE [Clostridia bacterium]